MAIPSLTGSEREAGEFLADFLARSGYRVERQDVTADRFNVLAFAAGSPRVIFCTHFDTVSPFLPVREDSDYLYGRGACDTKGIIAAMIEAGERLQAGGVRDFGYLLVVGEEVDGAGARRANQLDWNSQYVIVGEPTQNVMARAHKGTLHAKLTMEGRAAHSGYPEEGVSAIEGLWRVVSDCRDADWGNDAVLGRGSFNIGIFQGGERANIVPAKATSSVMIRTVEPRSNVEEKIRKLVEGRAAIEIISSNDPHIMHVVDGFPTTVVSFGSDVPYLGSLGKPLLVGPGSILDAHTASEKISKKELLEGANLYVELVKKLLA